MCPLFRASRHFLEVAVCTALRVARAAACEEYGEEQRTEGGDDEALDVRLIEWA